MSPIPASRFRQTLVAVAVVALTSGCATTASDPARGGDGITDGISGSIARAGQKTVGFGQTFVHRAGYLLGLHDDPGVPVAEAADAAPAPAASPATPGPATLAARPAPAPSGVPVARLPLNFDEVDLALMEEDAVMPGDGAADVAPGAQPDDDDLLAGFDDADMMDVLPFEDAAPVLGAPGDAPAVADPLDPLGLAAAPPAPAPTPAPGLAAATPGDAPAGTDAAAEAVAVVAAADLEHRVGESETLWDIAKKTTGDATNWHVLADVNDLGPGASVYPGQTLTIPADMLRPELAGGDALASASTDAPATATAPTVDADVALAATDVPTGRLVVPDAPSPVATPVTEPADGAREFEIAAGETLWDFAKRTTGDATNWQAIATQNGFDEGQAVAVRAGQRVFVPQDLVEEGGAVATAVPTVAAVPVDAAPAKTAPVEATPVETASAAGGDEPRFVPIPQVGDARGVDEAVDASATALAAANGADAASGAGTDAPAGAAGEDVRIVEASFTGGPEADLPADPAAGTESVMISGTYYPKAVYSDADFSAGLVTRVSPGTRLKVSSVDGQWYRVETERGAGWVHRRDVK